MPTSGGVAPSGGGGGGAGLMGVAVPFNDNEDFTPEELQTTVSKRRQEMTRTPEVRMCMCMCMCMSESNV